MFVARCLLIVVKCCRFTVLEVLAVLKVLAVLVVLYSFGAQREVCHRAVGVGEPGFQFNPLGLALR
jgi:hypothetical protein